MYCSTQGEETGLPQSIFFLTQAEGAILRKNNLLAAGVTRFRGESVILFPCSGWITSTPGEADNCDRGVMNYFVVLSGLFGNTKYRFSLRLIKEAFFVGAGI